MKIKTEDLHKAFEEVYKAMVEQFQCPGCVNGSSPVSCSKYVLQETDYLGVEGKYCAAHAPGTMMTYGASFRKIVLGLPIGFNKYVGDRPELYLFLNNQYPNYNKFNRAIWALEKDGYLFVRAYCPRINQGFINIIRDGKFCDLPSGVVDVSEFIDEVD